MDSGVETGNESNDTTVIAPHQFFSCSMSGIEPIGEQSQPKLELLFKNVPKERDIFTARGVKDNFVIDYPPVYQPASQDLILERAVGTECKEICLFEKSCDSEKLMADNLAQKAIMSSFFNPKNVIVPSSVFHTPETTHDLKCKMASKSYKRNRRRDGLDWSLESRHKMSLHTAVITNNTELLERILNEGMVSPDVADGLQRTPLHMAASRGYTEIIKLLLAHGANPNLKDKIGNTPLHLAAVTSKTEIVDLLLKAGTNVKSTDQFGNNPLDLAKTKLRVLLKCKATNIGNIKEEVENVVGILKLHLQKSIEADAEHALIDAVANELFPQFSLSNSMGQIQDDLKNLLSNLDSLSLSQSPRRVPVCYPPTDRKNCRINYYLRRRAFDSLN